MATGAGSFVRDATGPDLLTGAVLTVAASPEVGTVVDAQYPKHFAVEVVVNVADTTSPTLDITISAADNAAFDSGVVILGQFEVGEEDGVVLQQQFYTNKRYLQASTVITGTSADFTGTTAKLVPQWDRFTTGSTA